MNEPERLARLERAGYNVLQLDPADLRWDLFNDIPPHACVDEVQASERLEPEPDVAALATRIYGPARYLTSVKGRSAQVALAAGLRGAPAETVLAHPLFFATHHSLELIGAKIELARRRDVATSDLDIDWLKERLEPGDVGMVYLESNLNALGGRPLGLSNLEDVARLCRARGVQVVLDATRLLADCHAHGGPLFETAQAYTRLCDAFTVGASKELLVPSGALIAVRDEALERRIFTHAFLDGTLLEPLSARVLLARGMSHLLAHPELIADRARQLRLFADALATAGLHVIEPLGGHAVYLRLQAPGLAPVAVDERRPEVYALEALLYRLSGLRAVFFPYPQLGPGVVRLSFPIARYRDAELLEAARALSSGLGRAEEAPRLTSRRPGPLGNGLLDSFSVDGPSSSAVR